jgi:hypothetical protein
MRITFHIDRLVLEGLAVSPHAGPALSVAVESELTRLIESGGLDVPHGISVPRLSAPGVTLDRGATPASIGTHIAGSLFGGLSQPIDGPAQTPGTVTR